MEATATVITEIPLDDLRPGPWQPRVRFDAEDLAELAHSIAIRGILTPLRVVGHSQGPNYLIVAGERRWRAAKLTALRCAPCLVMPTSSPDAVLTEVALLDNVHRANLRPGEEARAVARLRSLGLTHRELASRVGKSVGWVAQRLAMAALPPQALARLDAGTMTREEALMLTRLADEPEWLAACVDDSGAAFKTRAGHVAPATVGARAQLALRTLDLERQRVGWAREMRANGHQVLDLDAREYARRYVALPRGSEVARIHQSAGLACEAWAWEQGHPIRYCTNPAALRRATDAPAVISRSERRRTEAATRILQLCDSRDALLKAWAATTRSVSMADVALLVNERIRSLTFADDGLLVRLGHWLGFDGDRCEVAAIAREELAAAGGARLLQLWFLMEIAASVRQSAIPSWVEPFLRRLGLSGDVVSPCPQNPGTEANLLGADAVRQDPPSRAAARPEGGALDDR